jgi:hypothetical protein
VSVPDVDPLYEVDFDGELGSMCSLHVAGHVDDDTATALAWAYLIEWGGNEWGHRIDRPQRVWTSQAPHVDEEGEQHDTTWEAVYSATPRDGWEPVTRIDLDPRPYRPCAKCAWQAVMGFPVDNFINPPTRANDGRCVWFCHEHAADISRRLDEARRAAYAEITAREAAKESV